MIGPRRDRGDPSAGRFSINNSRGHVVDLERCRGRSRGGCAVLASDVFRSSRSRTRIASVSPLQGLETSS